MPIWQMPRKIVWAEHGDDTVRTMAQHGRMISLRGVTCTGAFLNGANRNVNFTDHRRDFSRGFPQRFAGFAPDRMREFFFVNAKQASELTQRGDAGVHCQL